jgi:hypothetical protein
MTASRSDHDEGSNPVSNRDESSHLETPPTPRSLISIRRLRGGERTWSSSVLLGTTQDEIEALIELALHADRSLAAALGAEEAEPMGEGS